MFLFPFLFFFLTSPCITVFLFLESGDFASGDMTVSFRVWLSENDFRRVLLVDIFCEGWLWYVLCALV